MLGRIVAVALLGAAIAGEAPVAAASSAALRPAGTWTLREGDGRCVMERRFGPANRSILLSFTPGTLGTRPAIRLLEPWGSSAATVRRDPGSIALAPGGLTLPVTMRSYGPVGGQYRLTSAFVPSVTVRDLILAETLTFSRGHAAVPVAIAPDGSAAVVEALDRCEADRLRRLGVDPAAQPELSRRPEPVGSGAAAWFRPADYPHDRASPWSFGHVVAWARVTTGGGVDQCIVAQGSGNGDLDAKTCQLLQARGRYAPALGVSGQPVAAWVAVPVNWEPPAR